MSKKSLLRNGLLISAVASGFLLAACGGDPAPAAAPSPSTTTSTLAPAAAPATEAAAPTTTASATNAPAVDAPQDAKAAPKAAAQKKPTPNGKQVIGPDGYGSLKLGMSTEQAIATGMILASPPGDPFEDCVMHAAPGQAEGHFMVGISPEHGVALIFPRDDARTPEGIGVGSTKDEVKRAYPKLEDGPGGSGVDVPGYPNNHYVFNITKGKVVGISLSNQYEFCVS
ncbi:hypothetical protein [Actinokineospora globicatena]|uniref:hypothetical protein n=1 Tax=Actinokineospora globicatena TaxID=103729 RepID=UPI0020A58E52|nr:hypothetical protein [Actinokineospora globicatena]MCP2301177.1 hypothetical protein [Actinokineospora globicatena]GLW77187.1 hypothetical protein Aglo01_16690 [Actinokineospora globicatena]GLW84021.1 hypothetical protein Aglo02_16610 [Actinokineospora globicatena]